jgi:hypothetical protein
MSGLGARRAPVAAAAVAGALALGSLGAGCGSDNEGPVEEAGKAVDQGAKEVSSAADDVDVNVTTDGADVNVTTDADKSEDGKPSKSK